MRTQARHQGFDRITGVSNETWPKNVNVLLTIGTQIVTICIVYFYNFDPQKNRELIQLRGISFEEVISVLENKGPVDIIRHHNDQKYSHQRIYVVELHRYVYLVPFVEQENEIFLKTIFPSRKATKKYLGNEE